MTKCFSLLLAAALAFSGCASREEQPVPVESQAEEIHFTEDDAFYQEVMLNFGGVIQPDKNGRDRMIPTAAAFTMEKHGNLRKV